MGKSTKNLRINGAGEAIFKIVVAGYDGPVRWVGRIHELTRPELRGVLQPVTESDGWRTVLFDFFMPAIVIGGHPARFYLFGHEGIGFIGQPGSAKDAVYQSAHVVLGLAASDELAHLISVLGADLTRIRSTGGDPTLILASSVAAPPNTLPHGARQAQVDWYDDPLSALKLAVKAIVQDHQGG